jgi:hypothetical protein
MFDALKGFIDEVAGAEAPARSLVRRIIDSPRWPY